MRTADGAKFLRAAPPRAARRPLPLSKPSRIRSRVPCASYVVPTPLTLPLGFFVAFPLFFREALIGGWTEAVDVPPTVRTAASCDAAFWWCASLFDIGCAFKAELYRVEIRGSYRRGRDVMAGWEGWIPRGRPRLWLLEVVLSGGRGARWSNGGRRVKS